MALADFFHRSAVAAAQVLQGYDEDAIAERLDAVPVAIAVSEATLTRAEGRHLLDLTVRLLARLYPRLVVAAPAAADPWRDLALAINPALDLDRSDPAVAIVIGDAPSVAPVQFHVGCNGWDAHLSNTTAQPVGTSDNPLGPGAAACLAAANLFRHVFLPNAGSDEDLIVSTLTLETGPTTDAPPIDTIHLRGANALVGGGAIGQAALWALARVPVDGRLLIVDPELVDLGNLQRYVLTVRADVGRAKVDVALDHVTGEGIERAPALWEDVAAAHGHLWDRVLVTVDSAAARHAVQATLPRWIANAWTQPGDLGVSTHPWTSAGACLGCLYLPEGPLPDEDDLIADALGLSRTDDGLELRRLLATGGPPPLALLERVAASLDVPLDHLLPFAGRPLRELYVEGICGGAVLPLSRVGRPAQYVHVPLAHQSALAGVMLAGCLVADAHDRGRTSTTVTRINVLRPLAAMITRPALKNGRDRCICQDADYQRSWTTKYG